MAEIVSTLPIQIQEHLTPDNKPCTESMGIRERFTNGDIIIRCRKCRRFDLSPQKQPSPVTASN